MTYLSGWNRDANYALIATPSIPPHDGGTHNGQPYEANGGLAVNVGGAPVGQTNGLPVDANGAICTASADMVAAAGQLVPNPSAETDVTGWSTLGAGTGANVVRDTAYASRGSAAFKLTQGNAPGNVDIRHMAARFAATPGLTYVAQADFLAPSGTPARGVQTILDWYDNTATRITQSFFTTVTEIPGQWVSVKNEAPTAPANTVTAQVIARVLNADPGEVHYIDQVVAFQALTLPGGAISNAVWSGGFLRSPTGQLVTDTTVAGAAWHTGFMRTPAGALLVAMI